MTLLKGECRLNVRNRGKKFPHDVAESSGHEDLARLLWDEHDRLFPGIRHSGEPTPESGEVNIQEDTITDMDCSLICWFFYTFVLSKNGDPAGSTALEITNIVVPFRFEAVVRRFSPVSPQL